MTHNDDGMQMVISAVSDSGMGLHPLDLDMRQWNDPRRRPARSHRYFARVGFCVRAAEAFEDVSGVPPELVCGIIRVHNLDALLVYNASVMVLGRAVIRLAFIAVGFLRPGMH